MQKNSLKWREKNKWNSGSNIGSPLGGKCLYVRDEVRVQLGYPFLSYAKGFRVEVSLQLPSGVQHPLLIDTLWEAKEGAPTLKPSCLRPL